MTLEEITKKINERAADAGEQQAQVSRKLEANQQDKSKAEAAKRAALEAKDEEAYKKACRDLADANAGIEFNTICLQGLQRKPYATETEHNATLRELREAAQAVYVPAMLEIEKACKRIFEVASEAEKKYNAIDELARKWKRAVMNDHNERSLVINVSHEYAAQTVPYIAMVKGHLFGFENMHKNSPLFKEGDKK